MGRCRWCAAPGLQADTAVMSPRAGCIDAGRAGQDPRGLYSARDRRRARYPVEELRYHSSAANSSKRAPIPPLSRLLLPLETLFRRSIHLAIPIRGVLNFCHRPLRIAAWDLEVSSNTDIEYPANHVRYPRWTPPETDIFWFHGHPVVFHGKLDTDISIGAVISRARSFLNEEAHKGTARLILISLRHVALAEFSSDTVSCTHALPLIANTSTLKYPPGFRLFASILSSPCWKPSLTHRETLGTHLPPEIQDQILASCDPKDAPALARASFTFQDRYHSSTLPQLPDFSLRDFKHALPCCGMKRNSRETEYIHCPSCYTHRHAECTHTTDINPKTPVTPHPICPACQLKNPSTTLDPGGITHVFRWYPGNDCQVSISGSSQVLRLRRTKPSHLRPELALLGNLVRVPPCLIAFTIPFNGAFSGLVYGLDDS